MTLEPGTKLGPDRIEAEIGAGGMGEVYKATDTRLERGVAIKVLPPRFSEDTEMKQRFEREARVIAALNHSHICTLHDVGHQDGVDFLVMEYLEGESLAERLERGPLPLDEAKIAIEIADALDKAHGRCGSRSATKAWCATRPCIWRSESPVPATRKSSASGSNRPRRRSSGSAS